MFWKLSWNLASDAFSKVNSVIIKYLKMCTTKELSHMLIIETLLFDCKIWWYSSWEKKTDFYITCKNVFVLTFELNRLTSAPTQYNLWISHISEMRNTWKRWKIRYIFLTYVITFRLNMSDIPVEFRKNKFRKANLDYRSVSNAILLNPMNYCS